jgi:Ca-activated chloride channel family protein
MTFYPTRRRHGNGLLFVALLAAVIAAARTCDPNPPRSSGVSNIATPRVSTPVTNPIEDALRPGHAVQQRDGVVAAILIDTSGSMADRVKDDDGRMRPKIEIAQRAALDLVKQFDTYAQEHPDQTIFFGIYEFSDRDGPFCREVVKLGPAGKSDPVAMRSAVLTMRPRGGTPIGDAIITAKRDIDATGLSKRHILVITDGENNKGYSPEDVVRVITSQPDQARASTYFVAFDIAAAKFNPVRDAGGLVLAASNEPELKSTLDYVLTGKILAEQPGK